METAKEFLRRHNVRLKFRHHYRLKTSLSKRGFIVKTVKRDDLTDAWSLSLRVGTVIDGRDFKVVRRIVSEILREFGQKHRPNEIGVLVTGAVLSVYFPWSVGEPGIVTFWGR